MLLFSAHASLGLFIAVIVFLVLLVVGVTPLPAVIAGGVIGWILVQTVFRDLADRAEKWLTTPK